MYLKEKVALKKVVDNPEVGRVVLKGSLWGGKEIGSTHCGGPAMHTGEPPRQTAALYTTTLNWRLVEQT